jgi:hypothetical protein
LAKERHIVAARNAGGGTVPLHGTIFTDVLLTFICKYETYIASTDGPTIALLEGEQTGIPVAKVARQG